MEYIFSTLINFQIKVLSLSTDLKSCANDCTQLRGHLPYIFEGERQITSTICTSHLHQYTPLNRYRSITVSPIVDRLYKNDKIDRTIFPTTQDHHRVKTNERDSIFHLNAHFDFDDLIWKSGFFKIPKNKWRVTNDYKYPILGKKTFLTVLSVLFIVHQYEVTNITMSLTTLFIKMTVLCFINMFINAFCAEDFKSAKNLEELRNSRLFISPEEIYFEMIWMGDHSVGRYS